MSVYIKGFPLPNNCGACPLRLAWCRERIYMVTRPERCPLVPVPDHGRLIDESMIPWCVDWYAGRKRYYTTPKNIEHLPTIIPADPVKEEERYDR